MGSLNNFEGSENQNQVNKTVAVRKKNFILRGIFDMLILIGWEVRFHEYVKEMISFQTFPLQLTAQGVVFVAIIFWKASLYNIELL